MANNNVLINNHDKWHPFLKLKAGQVKGFQPPPNLAKCPYCGKNYNDVTEHPNR